MWRLCLAIQVNGDPTSMKHQNPGKEGGGLQVSREYFGKPADSDAVELIMARPWPEVDSPSKVYKK